MATRASFVPSKVTTEEFRCFDDAQEAKSVLTRTIIIRYFEEAGLFKQLVPTLRLINKAWRNAVNRRITIFRLTTMADSEGDRLLMSLERYPSVTALAIRKPKDDDKGIQACRMEKLQEATQLKSLRFDGLKLRDGNYIYDLLKLTQLTELRLGSDISFADPRRCLQDTQNLQHLLSFIFDSKAPRLTAIAADVWKKMSNLNRLSLRITAANTSVGMYGVMNLPKLEALRLAVPLSPNDVEMLCSMTQLKALFLEEQALPKPSQKSLSELTNLTRLQFVSSLIQVPQWLSSLTSLQSLKICWKFVSTPGFLLKNVLPNSLTSLSLRGVRGPIQRSIFDPLTSLKNLEIDYHFKGPDDINAYQSLTKLTHLIILRSFDRLEMKPLPHVHHLHCLRKLYIEDMTGIADDQVYLIARSLTALTELILGRNLSDDHLKWVGHITGLESFTLAYSRGWSRIGLLALCQLRSLRELCLFHSGNCPICQQFIDDILTYFACLEHLAMFPLEEKSARLLLPYRVSLEGNRFLSIDDDCRMQERTVVDDPWAEH